MTKHLAATRVAAAATALQQVGTSRHQVNPLIQFLLVSSCRENPGDQQVLLSPHQVTTFCDAWFEVPGHADMPWFVPLGNNGWNREATNGGYPIGTVWSTLDRSSGKRNKVFKAQALSPNERQVSLESGQALLDGLAGLVTAGSINRKLPLRELAIWRFRADELPDDIEIKALEEQLVTELKLTVGERAVLLLPSSDADLPAVFDPGPPNPDDLVELLPKPQNPSGQLGGAVAHKNLPNAAGVPIIDVELDDRLWRVIRNAVASFSCVLLVGPPGTGKGQILAKIAQEVAETPELYGFDAAPHTDGWPSPVVKTPHEGWQTFDLIGGHIARPEGGLRWAPGFLLDAIRDDRWVVLDETNRGDLDKIMGPLITWLAGGTAEIGSTSTGESRRSIVLGWTEDEICQTIPPEGVDLPDDELSSDVEYRAGSQWRLLGSFNPQDAQRVFPIGQALSRRFKSIPIPPLDPKQFEALARRQFPRLSADAVRRIKLLYSAHLDTADTVLGPALFLDIARYVVNSTPALDDDSEDDEAPLAGTADPGSGTSSSAQDDDEAGEKSPEEATETVVSTPTSSPPIIESADQEGLVAEGYLVTIGRFCANLDPAVLGQLRTNSGDALSEEQWGWIRERIRALAL